MRRSLRMAGCLLALSLPRMGSAAAQVTHVVRLVANAAKDEYRFEPASVVARPNDVIVFQVASGAPHSVVFEGEGLSPGFEAPSTQPCRTGRAT